ncbi:hypothetical protein FS837_003096 [Tulasnella sp. UAMH 9824]|nr:hypothetical protein FS837_003096 [Tulasnella sp. UAMH 9824]
MKDRLEAVLRPPFSFASSVDPDEAEDVDGETEAALERRPCLTDNHPSTLFLPKFSSSSSFQYWKEVIDSTPELWTRISSVFHPKLQEMILQNSRNQHLYVVYEDGNDWDTNPDKEENLAAFESMVEPLACRWKALKYYQGSSANNDRLVSLPMPNLTCIQIDGAPWRDQPITLDAPKLSDVHVSNCSLNWKYLSGLRDLSLRNTDPTLNTLMTILRASPGLRSLSLEKMSLDVEPNGFPDSMSKILLPQLHTLRIERGSTQSTSFLLDWIEAPSLETVRVEIGYRNASDDFTKLCESAGRHMGAFPLADSGNRFHLIIEVWDWEMSLGVGQQRILIWKSTWSRTIAPQVKLAYIASAVKRMNDGAREEVKVLDLACTNTEDIGEYLRIVHSHFPRIDQILVRDKRSDRADVDTFLQLLSSPSHLGLSEEWLLPNLTKLQLDLHRSIAANLGGRIVELLKSRTAIEGIEEITELRIVVAKGAIDPSTVELLRQSLVLFHLTEE